MFFKNYFLGVADVLQAKFHGHERSNQHSGDKGELCENFVQEFLKDSLADNFKIFRGGQVINSHGQQSKQLDIVLCGKRTIKIFGDKGIYPVESVFGVFSITSTLSFSKLKDCMHEFHSIPKHDYYFSMEKFYGEASTTATGLSEGIMWDFKKDELNKTLIDYYGFDESFIPKVNPAFSDQGTILPEMVEKFGFDKSVIVAYRAGDQPNNAFSLNVVNPGEIAATAGTLGVVYGVVELTRTKDSYTATKRY
jgi:hypothetical protein